MDTWKCSVIGTQRNYQRISHVHFSMHYDLQAPPNIPLQLAAGHSRLQRALDARAHISFYNIAVRFFATEWTKTLETLGVGHPQSTTTLLLAMIWDHFCKPLWTTRNNILHSTNNHVSPDEIASLKDKMCWYQCHQGEVNNRL